MPAPVRNLDTGAFRPDSTFVDPGYAASCYDTGGEAATEAARRVLDAARRAAIPVYFTRVFQSSPGTFLPVELALLLVVGGIVVGCAGGLVAAWGR